MNPGKLEDLAVLDQIFTPSFNLLELEARILQHGQLEELARSIAHCVRCGKCKPDCCVYHPARGMFFHPRNKNLAIGVAHRGAPLRRPARALDALRAAPLARGGGRPLHHLPQVPEALPGRHRLGRGVGARARILASLGLQEHDLSRRARRSRYLDSRSPAYNAAFRAAVVRLGGAVQRAACALVAPLQPADGAAAAPYALQMLRSPVPADPGGDAARRASPPCEPDQVLVLEPQAAEGGGRRDGNGNGDGVRTVFYFPGCGSERLQSHVSMAALHVLVSLGDAGRPPAAVPVLRLPGAREREDRAALPRGAARHHPLQPDPRDVLLPRVRRLRVTCGTCREGLERWRRGSSSAGASSTCARTRLERGLALAARRGDAAGLLYHPPCHDSLDGEASAMLSQ